MIIVIGEDSWKPDITESGDISKEIERTGDDEPEGDSVLRKTRLHGSFHQLEHISFFLEFPLMGSGSDGFISNGKWQLKRDLTAFGWD